MKPYVVPLILALSLTGIGAAILYALLKKDDDLDEPDPAFTKEQTIIKMVIPKECVSAVIGREGSNIKRIQEESGARVRFDRDFAPGAERECRISGTAAMAQKAETLIREFILSLPAIETVEMFVPQKTCGRIIGRGGENIRHITRTSGAKVILEDDSRTEPERRIILKGTAEQITAARELISEVVKEQTASMEELNDSIQNRSPRNKSKGGSPKPQSSLVDLDIGNDQSVDVFVSAVSSPERFWIQVLTLHGVKLDKLADEMTEYYSNEENQTLHKLNDINEGKIVAAVFDEDNKWYRAEVVSVSVNEERSAGNGGEKKEDNEGNPTENKKDSPKEENHSEKEKDSPKEGNPTEKTEDSPKEGNSAEENEDSPKAEKNPKEKLVRVFFVDYGDWRDVNESKVLELRTDFLTLRFQAIECFLANVKPVGEEWSEEATDLFEELASVALWEKKVAVIKTFETRKKLFRTNSESEVPGIELFDPRENEWVNIGEELIRRHLAVRNEELCYSEYTNGFALKDTASSEHLRAVPELSSDSEEEFDGFCVG